jgi:hypothetical protein
MLRAGVSLPALMKLMGHRIANMTLRHVEITQKDLQREFHLAQQQARHLIAVPTAKLTVEPDPGVIDTAVVTERPGTAICCLDLYRRQQPATHSVKRLALLFRRMTRVRLLFQKLVPGTETEKKARIGQVGEHRGMAQPGPGIAVQPT